MDTQMTQAIAAKRRMDALREGMQNIVASAAVAKKQGNVTHHAKLHAAATRLLLDYIDSGYITRLWNELDSLKP